MVQENLARMMGTVWISGQWSDSLQRGAQPHLPQLMCAAPAHDAEGHCNLSKQGCNSLDHIEGSRNDKLWACANPLCAADNMQQARTMQAQFHRVCLHHIEVCTLIHAYVQLIHANSYLYVYQYNNRNDPYISYVIISRCGSLRCIWKPI